MLIYALYKLNCRQRFRPVQFGLATISCSGVRAAVAIAMTPLLFIEYLYNQPLTTRSSE